MISITAITVNRSVGENQPPGVLVTYSANYSSLLIWKNCFSSKVNPIIIHLITFTLVFSDNTVKEEEITVNEKVSD